jgi:hypothetical protein
VWKWDLQPMWPEALPSHLSFLSPWNLWNQGIHVTETMEKLCYVNRDASIFSWLHTSVPSWNLQVVVFSKNIKRKQFCCVGNNNNVRDDNVGNNNNVRVLFDLRKNFLIVHSINIHILKLLLVTLIERNKIYILTDWIHAIKQNSK